MDIFSVKTTPFQDQQTGTGGLRRKTSVFKQKHYVENFVQSIFDACSGFEGKTLILGGDGRYFNDRAIQAIIKLAVANQFGRLIVGQNGLLSTPAVSHLVRKHKAFGALILSASHNPGGPDGDMGIKFDTHTGSGAQESLTNVICEKAKTIDRFWTCDIPDVDLSKTGITYAGATEIQVIDSVYDYATYMQQIFDFPAIKGLFEKGFTMRYDALNASSGPYAHYIFEKLLGAPVGTVVRGTPLPDFGGLHPEPNPVYAKDLCDLAYSDDAPDLCCASDGDSDRYLLVARHFYITPSDAFAIMADHIAEIPFYKDKVYGFARSMPTAWAVDLVARPKGYDIYETPTGWKFFESLLENKKITLCGEESFGASSLHMGEKDGIWAILLWLNILAYTGKTSEELVTDMWNKYGRVFYSLHNYDGLDGKLAAQIVDDVVKKLPTLKGKKFGDYEVESAGPYIYTDPITKEVSSVPCALITFTNKSKIIMRLSGTTSAGATYRIYLLRQVNDPALYRQDLQIVVKDLADIAEEISEVKKRTGRSAPSVIL